MKKALLAVSSGLALAFTSVPAVAQEEITEEQMDAMAGLFGDMFGTADPLTTDQEARVPAAQQVVVKLFPEGTYAKMMNESMRPMFDNMFGGLAGSPEIMLGQLTGLGPLAFGDVEEDKLAQALNLLDPQAQERNKAIADTTLNLISDIMSDIEPAYRAGLARAYAVRFTEAELADLNTYFQTPVGKKYAAESFLIFADPQVMEAMNEMVPTMMQRMPEMMGSAAEIAEQYPAGRKYSDLSADEQARLATLLGVTTEELAESEPESVDAPSPF